MHCLTISWIIRRYIEWVSAVVYEIIIEIHYFFMGYKKENTSYLIFLNVVQLMTCMKYCIHDCSSFLHDCWILVSHMIPAYAADLGYVLVGKKPRWAAVVATAYRGNKGSSCLVFVYIEKCVMLLSYGDGVSNTLQENSNILSLIQMH